MKKHTNVYSDKLFQFSSVTQSCPTLCDPQGLQHVRPPCPSPTPGVYSNSCPLSRWCHPTISSSVIPFSSSVIPFSSCPQSFRHQNLFQWVSSSHQVAKVLEFQLQHQSFQYHSSKASILRCSAFFMVQLSHPYITTGKTIALTRQAFVGKVMSLPFNMLSRLVITFLPRSKHLFNFMAAVTICSDFAVIYPFEFTVPKNKKAFLSDQCKE